MGEALLHHRAGHIFHAYSAGTTPTHEIFPPVVEAMQELGIDLSDKRPKGIDEFLGKVHFENVIIVCGNAEKECPAIFGSAERLFWPFDDPAAVAGSHEDILKATRQIRDQIDGRIAQWLDAQGIESQGGGGSVSL
jgi:arsenate reductase